MRIAAISPCIGRAFRELGHETLILRPKGPAVLNLSHELAGHGFKPDLIFQEESLGPRVILSGLDNFDCPKIFWSVDTHLNLFWHAPYSMLFDGLMSPHMSILDSYISQETAYPLPPRARLAYPGMPLPWRPFDQRKTPLSFIGRITKYRPTRKHLVDFLQTNYRACIKEDLSRNEMLEVYQDTRLAPNESIMEETNFRLMESASCGCLGFSQDVGPDQDVLFNAGRELEIYHDVLELKELLDYYLEHPRQAEAKARLAWERVQREHLPVRRAEAIISFLPELAAHAATGDKAREFFYLTMFHMNRAHRISLPGNRLELEFAALSDPSPKSLAARLLLLIEEGLSEQANEFLTELFSSLRCADSFELNSAASLGALRLDNWGIAKEFWYRHQKTAGIKPVIPVDACDLYQLWSREFKRKGIMAMPGLAFEPDRQVPSSALDCLLCAIAANSDPERALGLTNKAWTVVSQLKGGEHMGIGYLSDLTLHCPDNWRNGLRLALLNLKSFRLREGLEEAALALHEAEKQNALPAFQRFLRQSDRGGRLTKLLVKA